MVTVCGDRAGAGRPTWLSAAPDSSIPSPRQLVDESGVTSDTR